MSKKGKIFLSFFCVIITLVICASVYFNVKSIDKINETNKLVKEYMGLTDDEDKEDDVVIAQRYTIKSTRQISDAYLSGDTSKLSDADKETLELASDVIKEIIKPDMSDFEKEKAVYLYLTKTMQASEGILTVISTSEENYEPHDVLKNKSAVCVGYATTFRLLMQMLNIECKVVHSDNLTHSWDLVKLDDGWYHTDCYSDVDSSLYMNFNMNDDTCFINHSWTREYYPEANGAKYNYILMNAKEMKNIFDLPDYAGKMIKKGKELVSCSFKTLSEEEQYIGRYISDSIQNMFSEEDKSFTTQWITGPDGEFVFVLSITDFSDQSSDELDDKTIEKIDNLLEKAAKKYGLEYDYTDYDNNDEYYLDENVMYENTMTVARG